MDASNTGDNRPNNGRFKKGDPRINRKGRPKSFDALRALAQSIANEVATDDKRLPLIIDGHHATNAEMLMRKMLRENPERFVEIAYGKVPAPIELTGKDGGPVEVITPYDYNSAIAGIVTDESTAPAA